MQPPAHTATKTDVDDQLKASINWASRTVSLDELITYADTHEKKQLRLVAVRDCPEREADYRRGKRAAYVELLTQLRSA